MQQSEFVTAHYLPGLCICQLVTAENTQTCTHKHTHTHTRTHTNTQTQTHKQTETHAHVMYVLIHPTGQPLTSVRLNCSGYVCGITVFIHHQSRNQTNVTKCACPPTVSSSFSRKVRSLASPGLRHSSSCDSRTKKVAFTHSYSLYKRLSKYHLHEPDIKVKVHKFILCRYT